PVAVADERPQVAQRRLEVGPLALELLDVRDRLVVLGLRERVDRTQLLAPALQALDPRAQSLGLLVGEGLVGRLGRQAKPLGEPGELVSDLVLLVADLL